MNKYLILTIFMSISFASMAQRPKNSIKIGVMASSTPYLQSEQFGPMIQYSHQILDPLGIRLTLGGFRSPYNHNFGYLAYPQSSSAEYVNKIESKELLAFFDYLITYDFFQKKRFNIIAGTGISVLHSRLKTRISQGDGSYTEYDFPAYIYIKDNRLQMVNDEIKQPTVLMASVSLEVAFNLTEKINIGLNGGFRTAFTERKVLTHMIENSSDTKMEIHNYVRGMKQNTSLSIALGYRF